jgi:molybdopterin converting factor small subunit
VVQVKLLGGLAKPLGRRVEIEARDVGELLEELVRRGGPELESRFFAEAGPAGELHRDLRVLVNGRSIAFLDGRASLLAEPDVVTLHQTGVRGYPGG